MNEKFKEIGEAEDKSREISGGVVIFNLVGIVPPYRVGSRILIDKIRFLKAFG